MLFGGSIEIVLVLSFLALLGLLYTVTKDKKKRDLATAKSPPDAILVTVLNQVTRYRLPEPFHFEPLVRAYVVPQPLLFSELKIPKVVRKKAVVKKKAKASKRLKASVPAATV